MAVMLNTFPLANLGNGGANGFVRLKPTLCGSGIVYAATSSTTIASYNLFYKGVYTTINAGNYWRTPGIGNGLVSGGGFAEGGCTNSLGFLGATKTSQTVYPAYIIGDKLYSCGFRAAAGGSYISGPDTAAFLLAHKIGDSQPFAHKCVGLSLPSYFMAGTNVVRSGIFGHSDGAAGNDVYAVTPVLDKDNGQLFAGVYITGAGGRAGFNISKYSTDPYKVSGASGTQWFSQQFFGYKSFASCDGGELMGPAYAAELNGRICGVTKTMPSITGVGAAIIAVNNWDTVGFIAPDDAEPIKPAGINYYENFARPGLMLTSIGITPDTSKYPGNNPGTIGVSVMPGRYIDNKHNRRNWFSFAHHHAVGATLNKNVPDSGGYILPSAFDGDNFIAISTDGDNTDDYVIFALSKPTTPRNGAFGYAANITFPDMGPTRVWADFSGAIYSIWLGSDNNYWLAVSSIETQRYGASSNFARYFPFNVSE